MMKVRSDDATISRRQAISGVGRAGLALWLGGSAISLAACGSSDDAGGAIAPRGAWIHAETGRLASAWAPIYAGAHIAVREINDAGGILGEELVLAPVDDEGSPATQPGVARRVVADRPAFVMGPSGSSQAVASVTALARAELVQSALANADSLGDARRFPYHYQLVFNTGQQGRLAARFLVERRGLERVGLLVENTEYGEAVRSAVEAALQEYDTRPVAVEVFEPEAPDLTPYVRKLAAARVEGLGMFSGAPQAMLLALRAMGNADFAPTMVSADLNDLDAYFDQASPELLDRIYGVAYRQLTYAAGERPSGPGREYAEKIAADGDARAARFSAANSPYYDYLKLLASAAEGAGSLEPAALKEALDATDGYEGARARVSFTPEQHAGIPDDEIAMATLASARDDRSIGGILRERVDA